MVNTLQRIPPTFTVLDLRDHSRGFNAATPELAVMMAGRLVRHAELDPYHRAHGLARGSRDGSAGGALDRRHRGPKSSLDPGP